MTTRRKLIQGAVGASVAVATLGTGTAWGQDAYPSRPIKVVIPFPAGGSTDVIGRAVAQKLGEQIGQTVVVENVGGASTMIGADRVAKSAPDGYTLLVASSTTFSANPHLFKKMTYSIDDFVGVSLIAQSPLVLAVAPNAPFSNLRELVAYAKPRPGQVAYGTTGRGGISHLVGEMAASVMGIKMIDVPYKGSAPALTDVMGGQLPIHVDSAATSLPLLNSGKIKVLAITSAERAEGAPNVPTFAESGYPDMVVATLIGLFAPAKTPRAIVDKLNAAMKKVLEDPDLRARFRPDATIGQWTTPEVEVQMFKADRERFGKIIKSMNIEMQ